MDEVASEKSHIEVFSADFCVMCYRISHRPHSLSLYTQQCLCKFYLSSMCLSRSQSGASVVADKY